MDELPDSSFIVKPLGIGWRLGLMLRPSVPGAPKRCPGFIAKHKSGSTNAHFGREQEIASIGHDPGADDFDPVSREKSNAEHLHEVGWSKVDIQVRDTCFCAQVEAIQGHGHRNFPDPSNGAHYVDNGCDVVAWAGLTKADGTSRGIDGRPRHSEGGPQECNRQHSSFHKI